MSEAGRRVLVVDDDEQVRHTFRRVLETLGLRVVTAEDAAAALAVLADADFDLLITDLKMAGMDGLALTREVGRIRPGLPVVVTTGFVTDVDLDAIAEAGAVFLAKPFNVTAIQQALARAWARDQA